jgi:hypothetical protein
MTERSAPLLRWAEGYYPSKPSGPPDVASMNLTDAELIEMFARVPSRRAHHALVDQPAIRNRLSDMTLSDAASAAWLRTQ